MKPTVLKNFRTRGREVKKIPIFCGRFNPTSIHDPADEGAVHPGVVLGLEGVLQEVLELPHGIGGGRLVLGGEGRALEGVVVVVRVQVHVDAVRWRHLDWGQTALFTSVLLDYYT